MAQSLVRLIMSLGLLATTAFAEQVAWEARAGFRDFGRIVVVEGVVISGNTSGTGAVVAFDAATGKLSWRTPGQLKAGPVTDGRVAFVVQDARPNGAELRAYDPKSGKVLWQVSRADVEPRVNLLAHDGRVFVPGAYGKLRAYDTRTGALAWEHTYLPGDWLASCPTTPTAAAGTIYYGGGENAQPGQGVFVWAVDAATGRERWRFAARPTTQDRRGVCVTQPVVADGIVVVTSEHVAFGLDASTGAQRWSREARSEDGTPRTLSPAVISGGRAYAITRDALVGWRLQDGRPDFEFKGVFPAANKEPSLQAVSGLLYFVGNLDPATAAANPQGFLVALDPATSSLLWTHRVNRDVQYQDRWGTRFFAVVGADVYYENNGFLAKIRP